MQIDGLIRCEATQVNCVVATGVGNGERRIRNEIREVIPNGTRCVGNIGIESVNCIFIEGIACSVSVGAVKIIERDHVGTHQCWDIRVSGVRVGILPLAEIGHD